MHFSISGTTCPVISVRICFDSLLRGVFIIVRGRLGSHL
jgi:hypothetical protein